MAYKVGMVSLGCAKNQVDGERMLYTLKKDGFIITGNVDECDAIIVNTCGFIDDAKQESIDNILEVAALKKKHLKVLAVTGCLSERYQLDFTKEFPEVDVVLGQGSVNMIASAIKKALEGKRTVEFGEKSAAPLIGERILTTPPYYAYLKIAEGCDNRCAFCAIPDIKGHFVSAPMEEILKEAQELCEKGVREINVVAQDPTRYGQDINGKFMLPQLLHELCKIEKLKWVRLLYCYPDRVTDELIATIRDEEKIVKYIDLPLQHISDSVLKRMNRRGTSEYIKSLLQRIRKEIPKVVIRTTFIAGLPGETEEDFAELCSFVKDSAFERMGCFAYSQEENTPAGEMENQIPEELRRKRADELMELQMGIALQLSGGFEGDVLEVLCEGYDSEMNCYSGRSYMDAPDIDTKVFFTSKNKIETGEFVEVLITGSEGYDLTGETCIKE
ncbi:MAG: 30S ribosomal protein S12 methylthiotransferase RimO [Oscillospiraceae bacterium]